MARTVPFAAPKFGTTAASSMTPDFIGQIYIKTDDSTIYIGYGTALGEFKQVDSDPLDDVTAAAVLADNRIIRGNGGVRGVQDTGITIADTTNDMSGVGALGCGAITSSGTLALGANSITMTGSLGATGAGKLTKVWSTDAEFINLPTINGGTLATALSLGTMAAETATNYAKLASPTFTGTVTIPTPFTLGIVSVTTTGTQLNYLASSTGSTGTNTTNVVFSEAPTLTGLVNISEGLKVNTTDVTAATYDLLVADNVLLVSYTATGAVTSLTLPTAQCSDGRTITIKDSGGNAGANNITIDTEGAQKIDGVDTYVINNDYDSVTLVSNGSHWFSI